MDNDKHPPDDNNHLKNTGASSPSQDDVDMATLLSGATSQQQPPPPPSMSMQQQPTPANANADDSAITLTQQRDIDRAIQNSLRSAVGAFPIAGPGGSESNNATSNINPSNTTGRGPPSSGSAFDASNRATTSNANDSSSIAPIYSNDNLPPNIDITAEATLVPNPDDDPPQNEGGSLEEEEDLYGATQNENVPDATPVDEPSSIGIRIRDEPDVEVTLQAPCVNRRASFSSVASLVILDAGPVLELPDQAVACDDAHPNKLIRNMHADMKAYYWQRFAFRVCVLLCLLGIGLGLGLGLSGSSKDEEQVEGLTEGELLNSFWNDIVLHLSPEIDRNNPPPAYNEAINWILGPDNDYNINITMKELRQFKVRYVIALIYYSTGGPGWTRGELSKTHHCQWSDEWIECGMNHHGQHVALEGILLGDNNLNGTLPTEIGLLAALKRLQLHNNPNLEGELPQSLALLDMKQLLIQNTSIVGSLDYMCDRCDETILCEEYKADVDCDCCN